MEINSAQFVISSKIVSGCPSPNLPEYAFIGRSNVGKSSLINMITGEKKLAKTSSTPGKTQLINHFIINNTWYLADLPGYGYARLSKETREKFGDMIKGYLLKRENLLCTFILIDIRIEAQNIDLEFMEWMGLSQIPFVIVFTKKDKLKRTQINTHLEAYKKVLLTKWDELPQIITSSAETKEGKEEILGFIEKTNTLFQP
ncbi:MAG TPA: ribosome biogenesis GTP-binding protein YihA/YsxC [Bacteroidales bacterium]|nr:ribosome biogenesis GTP-binding protein YihA/YsxC [Bacteroidales bacterium]